MKMDQVIVGAGITGAILARRLVEEFDTSVWLIEKENYVGGFCYDERDSQGILIHRFGPHIFRTDEKEVYDYLSRFTQWYDYQHKVRTYVEGHTYPMPINLDTINQYFHTNYTCETIKEFYQSQAKPIVVPTNVEEQITSQVGTKLYELFYKEYTKKQWGVDPKSLSPSVVSRIPVRCNGDDRYFTCKYQGIPKDGYTALIKNILNHPRIHIMLNTNFSSIKDEIEYDHLYYTGSIDEYFDYCYGELPYRSVQFKFEEYDMEYFQETAVVNYPNDNDYTRITEFKHFLPYKEGLHTVIAKEYSQIDGNPSYPIPNEENQKQYEMYASTNQDSNVTFLGRLGEYRYYSMDQIVSRILHLPLHITK